MKQETASSLWLIVGAALFYFLFNAVAAAQHWPFDLPGVKFEGFDRYAVALVATPIGLLASSILLCLGAEHARKSKSHCLSRRLPVPFRLGDPDSAILQAVQLVSFVLLPVVALVSLYLKYLGGQFCRRAQDAAKGCDTTGYVRIGDEWDHFNYVPWGLATKSREFVYQGGPDYWPFWEAIGISLLWVALAAALGWFLICLLRR